MYSRSSPTTVAQGTKPPSCFFLRECLVSVLIGALVCLGNKTIYRGRKQILLQDQVRINAFLTKVGGKSARFPEQPLQEGMGVKWLSIRNSDLWFIVCLSGWVFCCCYHWDKKNVVKYLKATKVGLEVMAKRGWWLGVQDRLEKGQELEGVGEDRDLGWALQKQTSKTRKTALGWGGEREEEGSRAY